MSLFKRLLPAWVNLDLASRLTLPLFCFCSLSLLPSLLSMQRKWITKQETISVHVASESKLARIILDLPVSVVPLPVKYLPIYGRPGFLCEAAWWSGGNTAWEITINLHFGFTSFLGESLNHAGLQFPIMMRLMKICGSVWWVFNKCYYVSTLTVQMLQYKESMCQGQSWPDKQENSYYN